MLIAFTGSSVGGRPFTPILSARLSCAKANFAPAADANATALAPIMKLLRSVVSMRFLPNLTRFYKRVRGDIEPSVRDDELPPQLLWRCVDDGLGADIGDDDTDVLDF